MIAPCKGCEERQLGCHAICKKYKDWKKEIDTERKYNQKERQKQRFSFKD